jgi:hypothetical protein
MTVHVGASIVHELSEALRHRLRGDGDELGPVLGIPTAPDTPDGGGVRRGHDTVAAMVGRHGRSCHRPGDPPTRVAGPPGREDLLAWGRAVDERQDPETLPNVLELEAGLTSLRHST